MQFIYSSRKQRAEKQRAFVRRAFRHLPTHVRRAIKALPVEVVFTAPEGDGSVCIYEHGERRIYMSPGFWQSYDDLEPPMRKEHKRTFLHECFHAFDFNKLPIGVRDGLLMVFTGYPTNHHYDAWGVPTPAHVTPTERKAAWMYVDWEFRAAELFADSGTAAFTNLPWRGRSPRGLQITEESVEATRQAVAEAIGDAA